MLKRYVILFVAYTAMALGIALLNNAQLGSPPVASVPYTLYRITGMTVGTLTLLMNIILLVGQKLVLGNKFGRSHLMQIPAMLAFSVFIDLAMWLTYPLINNFYGAQMAMSLIGCLLLAGGIFLQVSCAIVFVPTDGFVAALTQRFGWGFGKSKLGFDLFLAGLSALISWCVLGELVGIREGTLIAAILIGNMIQFATNRWGYPIAIWLRTR